MNNAIAALNLQCLNVERLSMIADRLPVIPRRVLGTHHVYKSSDDRFRACARLLQALWREEQQLPMGDCVTSDGVARPLGSRVADGADSGRNFLTPEIADLAWREMVYREHGAVIEEERLWTNLLSSQPLTFNILGPLRLDLAHATSVLRALCPSIEATEVTNILFEHSPGRRDKSLTGDNTAFDALMVYRRADGRRGFVAMEFKYSEGCRERARTFGLTCETALIASQLHNAPSAEELQTAPLQQLTREHVLAQAALSRGDYDEGHFVVIAPELNLAVRAACERYSTHLVRPATKHVNFHFWSLETLVDAMRQHGDADYAQLFHDRYLAWDKVEKAIEATRPKVRAQLSHRAEPPRRIRPSAARGTAKKRTA